MHRTRRSFGGGWWSWFAPGVIRRIARCGEGDQEGEEGCEDDADAAVGVPRATMVTITSANAMSTGAGDRIARRRAPESPLRPCRYRRPLGPPETHVLPVASLSKE